jgi:Fur family ferric uptake transcriptional regulator
MDVQAFERRLRDRGLRITPERRAVLREVLRESTHFGAETLYDRLRGRSERVSRATVYRTLGHLVESGIVRKYDLGDRQTLYEPCLGKEHHEHMICVVCGGILEFVHDEIERLQDETCRRHGFRPLSHTLQIHGVCGACDAAARDGRGATDPGGSTESLPSWPGKLERN